MIRLTRERTKVPQEFVGDRRKARVLELYRAARDGLLDDRQVKKQLFNSSRWSGSKDQLKAESDEKCAFCEQPVTGSYYGDVEHFRPKGTYWWLAYCYDNYLFSCRVCNGSKHEKHTPLGMPLPVPEIPAGMSDEELIALANRHSPSPDDAQSLQLFEEDCRKESEALPNPYHLDPETLFIWIADGELKEVVIAPAPGANGANAAFNAVDTVVNLNRPELRTLRWQTYELAKKIVDLAAQVPEPSRSTALSIVSGMTDRNLPFSAMMRYFAREWGALA